MTNPAASAAPHATGATEAAGVTRLATSAPHAARLDADVARSAYATKAT